MGLKYHLKSLASKSFFTINKFYDDHAISKDKKRGVDFYKNVKPENIEGYDHHKYVHYIPSKSWQIKRLLKASKITCNDAIFDYGCGKGKALYEFSKYKLNKIGGIELAKELADIAKINMQKLNLPNVKIVNGNALNFTELDDYNYFFFFDPFSVDIFKSVINIILTNYKKNPREITIIYMNLRGHDKYLDTIEGFIKHKTLYNPVRSVIYKYNP
ncbi:methyltransferase domain-containing protein [Seonamhaeicola sp.]|uniref:class I SAM-dependent methyltransferase n=1 Tax=Seonamhaeicola sp. TaxID=1912245 RepID=UPI00262F36CB|nr:methyltransferase domain-containing protein [Seonamhaeicola sp.]